MEILSRYFSHTSFKNKSLWIYFTAFILLFGTIPAAAGPFYYGSEYEKHDRIHMDDPDFIGWASGFEHYKMGKDVDEGFQTPEKALGKASNNAFDIVSLGRGGSITLTFDHPIKNGEGWDFAIFENAFNDDFLELAYVEVSSDGNTFVRFNNCSLTLSPVNGFGTIDPTNITGFAGKYRKGYGTPFDLLDLVGKPEIYSGIVNLNRISHVRIIDIIGDRTCYDDRTEAMKNQWGENSVIYDPYPTYQSAGFDLDAVGIRYQNTSPEGANNPPNPPLLLLPENKEKGVSLTPTFLTDSFDDPDQDLHIKTRWQISKDKDFSAPNLLLNVTSFVYLTSLTLKVPILEAENNYYWRAKFYDTSTDPNILYNTSSDPNILIDDGSVWSETYLFTTTHIDTNNIDNNSNGIPDIQEFGEGSTEDLNYDTIPDIDQVNSQFKCLKNTVGNGKSVIETSGQAEILFFEFLDPNSILNTQTKSDNLPLGLLNLQLKSELSEDPNITIYISEPVPTEAKWFTFDLKDGCLKVYSDAVSFTEDGKSFRLRLKDGGPGDLDGVSNGKIISVGGYFSKVIPPPDEEAGFGGMGSCFITICFH